MIVEDKEIIPLGSWKEVYTFPAVVNYLYRGKIKVDGIVNKVFKFEQWEECLESMRNKTVIKAAIIFDQTP